MMVQRYAVLAALGSLAVATALALAGAVASDGAPAQASQIKCGTTIKADTTLDGDLVGCPNGGIVIDADGITLDLNGHTISGDGKPFEKCPEEGVCDAGVLIDEHRNVTVKGGSVRDFDVGVFAGGAPRTRVLRIAAAKNRLFGFVLGGSPRSLVRRSSGNGSPAPEGDGIGLFGSNHVSIVDSSFRRNAQLGIHVEDSHRTVIEGNLLARNGDMGILMEGDHNQLRRNRCMRNGACIILPRGSGNVIARNRVDYGIGGIFVENGDQNLVARNVVVGVRRTGILLGLLSPPVGGVGNVARDNVVRDAGGDGFQVGPKARRSVLARNVATGSKDDGFDVASRSTKLTANRALRNGDLGIEAVRGVVNGGGNVARHNGDRRQCAHLRCG